MSCQRDALAAGHLGRVLAGRVIARAWTGRTGGWAPPRVWGCEYQCTPQPQKTRKSKNPLTPLHPDPQINQYMEVMNGPIPFSGYFDLNNPLSLYSKLGKEWSKKFHGTLSELPDLEPLLYDETALKRRCMRSISFVHRWQRIGIGISFGWSMRTQFAMSG